MTHLDDVPFTGKSDSYVDLQPDKVTAGVTVQSSLGRVSKYKCNWCGHRFISSGGSELECPECINESIHHRPPIARFDNDRLDDFNAEPPMCNEKERIGDQI